MTILVAFLTGNQKDLKLSKKCTSGKRCFDTEKIAQEALIQHHIINDYPSNQGPRSVYQCEDCGVWHFTSKCNVSLLNDPDVIQRIKKERVANEWERKLR